MKRQGSGTVYLIGNPEWELYRIGWTDNHLDVIASKMRRGNSFPVMECASMFAKDASALESRLKDEFHSFRVLGGWYHLDAARLRLARRLLGLDLLL